MPLSDFKEHLTTVPERPNWIPHRIACGLLGEATE
jgi:hypothetical protein